MHHAQDMTLKLNIQKNIVNKWTDEFITIYLPEIDNLMYGGIFNKSSMTVSIMNQIHSQHAITDITDAEATHF